MPIRLFRKTDTVGKPFCRTEFQLVFMHKERSREARPMGLPAVSLGVVPESAQSGILEASKNPLPLWRAFPILTTILFSLPADPCSINMHLDHKGLNLRSN